MSDQPTDDRWEVHGDKLSDQAISAIARLLLSIRGTEADEIEVVPDATVKAERRKIKQSLKK